MPQHQTLYEGIAKELLGQLRRLKAFTGHTPSIGDHHEEVLRHCLRSMLSQRHSIKTGFVLSEDGRVSQQGDLLIVDNNYPAPYHFQSGDLVVVQPRAVSCVIEVKTSLTKKTFADAMHNLASFVRVAPPGAIPASYLFAFEGKGMTAKQLIKWYENVSLPHEVKLYPRAIYSLTKGLLLLSSGRNQHTWGHRYVGEAGKEKAKGLSIFLQSIRKHLELSAGIKANPFRFADLEGLKHYDSPCFRFGNRTIIAD